MVLSKDDRIRRSPVEREALLALRKFDVPFIAGVSIAGEMHVFESGGERHVPPKRLKP